MASIIVSSVAGSQDYQGSSMVPFRGPLPASKGSEVWALGFFFSLKGIRIPIEGPLLRGHGSALRTGPSF